jgi:hypothetical protein
MGLFSAAGDPLPADGLGSLLKWPAALRRDPPAPLIAGRRSAVSAAAPAPAGDAVLSRAAAAQLRRVAAADIDIDVAAGERWCLIGSNGAARPPSSTW